MAKGIVIQTTTASAEDAERIAEALLAERLAACVQVAPVRSLYVWKGELQREGEQLLAIKTTVDLFDGACARIRELHTYERPEIIALPMLDGDPDYLAWLVEVTRRL